ncbi:ABC transporter ATP-binding protein [Brevibacillus panacihumi]|uniref:ABC transporter ATP-binding protein n=1 Tax=Brevibacillus panacihumi TaxID=497735 RepID=UPI001FE68AC7|nr:ABC transporter ATP-binding protein [Brevibacillus panacihumi]
METLILSGVSKNYGKHIALQNVSLEIEFGMFGLLGPNGAGKTTLMRILTTLLSASSGEIRFGNLNWNEPHKIRNIIGYLPQKFYLYKQIKVREALQHIAKLKGIQSNNDKAVDSVIEKVNLSDQRDKKIGKLSGGMVRRLGIAQAILGDPKIIVVDEPTAGLDPEERIRFRRLLRQLGRETIVIISTHIVEDIEATCDKAAILHKGQLIKSGDIHTLGKIAQGKVWEVSVSEDDFHSMYEKCNVISSHRTDNIYRLRILSEEPPMNAGLFSPSLVTPSLEDAYLYLMNKKG